MPGIPNIDIDPPKYGPPNMAAQLFGMISSLPDAYQQGVKQKFERGQMARTEELQKPYEGPTDYASMLQHVLRTEGTEGVSANLPNAWKQQFLGNDQPTQSPYGPQNPRTSPDAQTPGGLRGETEQPQGTVGQYSISDLATRAGGLSDPKAAAANIAKVVGVAPGARLTDEQEARVRQILSPYMGQGDASDATGTTGAPDPRRSAPPNVQPGIMGGPPTVGPSAAAQGFAPYQPGAPPQGAPPAQVAQAGQTVPSGAAGMVPTGADPRAYAQGLKQAAERERTAARREGIAGIPSKAREDKAAAYDKTADDILKEIGEAGRPTGPQKEARDAVVQGSKGLELAQKQELTRGDALQKGVQGAAREYETALKPHLDAMRGILNNPNFVSGAGVGFQEALNKIRSSPLFAGLPGYDPNAALPNEAIRKVVAASILNQTTELKAEAAEMGGSAGRLFQQQISLMEKAAQNPENTAPALRYLTELQTRMGDHASGIAELANNYQGKYGKGVLDNGFNEVLSKYNRGNPIFKPEEIADMRRFAPPPAPAFHTKEEATAWAHKNNIPAGDPIKLPSGKIIPAP